jgi:PKD repeat protein
MKKLFFLGILTSVLLFSCSKDETTPLVADFTTTVTGEAPNAQISITNNSTGATNYSWTFGEGASVSSSTDENPSSITVDKAGDLSIKLVAGNGSEEKELSKTITVTGNSAILSYSDIEFATAPGSEEYGRFFVSTTGEILKDSEVTSENGPTIDVAYNQFNPTNTTGFFTSPDDLFDEFVIPGATTSQFVNYVTDELSVAQFDAMENDLLLNSLEITNDNEAIGMSGENIILFKTADNLKGAIKTKALNADRLLVDIKVQKY